MGYMNTHTHNEGHKVVGKEVGVDPGGIERGVEGTDDQTTLYEMLRKFFLGPRDESGKCNIQN